MRYQGAADANVLASQMLLRHLHGLCQPAFFQVSLWLCSRVRSRHVS